MEISEKFRQHCGEKQEFRAEKSAGDAVDDDKLAVRFRKCGVTPRAEVVKKCQQDTGQRKQTVCRYGMPEYGKIRKNKDPPEMTFLWRISKSSKSLKETKSCQSQ